MLRLLFLLCLVCSCSTKKPLNIILVKGGPLNERQQFNEVALYEDKAARLAFSRGFRPQIIRLTKGRALRAFDQAECDLVVFGQAVQIPAEYEKFAVKVCSSGATLLSLKKSSLGKTGKAASLLKKQLNIALLRDSIHAGYFVNNLHNNSLHFFVSFEEALQALQEGRSDAVVIDSVAAEDMGLGDEYTLTALDLPTADIVWLQKKWQVTK